MCRLHTGEPSIVSDGVPAEAYHDAGSGSDRLHHLRGLSCLRGGGSPRRPIWCLLEDLRKNSNTFSNFREAAAVGRHENRNVRSVVFFYEDLNCLNCLKLTRVGFVGWYFTVTHKSYQNSGGGSKEDVLTLSMAFFCSTPSLLLHCSLSHMITTLCCDWLKCSQENV